jgi:hypothetical protein
MQEIQRSGEWQNNWPIRAELPEENKMVAPNIPNFNSGMGSIELPKIIQK